MDGRLSSEAEFFVKRLNDFLAMRWERPYNGMGQGLPLICDPEGCTVVCACKWRSLGIVDGASLPIMTVD